MFTFLGKIRSTETLGLNEKYCYIFKKRTKLLVKFIIISMKTVIYPVQLFFIVWLIYQAIFKLTGIKLFQITLWLPIMYYLPRKVGFILVLFVAFICLTTNYLQLSFRQTFDEMNTNKKGKSEVPNQCANFLIISNLYKTV